jgi:predicted RNA-binding Zn-ribbon protein involved in translation (DUF1610 family)
MANLDTYCCPSCGKEFVIRSQNEVPCPACGASFIVRDHIYQFKPAEAEKHNRSRPSQPGAMRIARTA